MQPHFFLLSFLIFISIACKSKDARLDSESNVSFQTGNFEYVAPKCDKPNPRYDAKKFAAKKNGRLGKGMITGVPVVDEKNVLTDLVINMKYDSPYDDVDSYLRTHFIHLKGKDVEDLLEGETLKKRGNFRDIRLRFNDFGAERVYRVYADYATGDTGSKDLPEFYLSCVTTKPEVKTKGDVAPQITQKERSKVDCNANVTVDVKHSGSYRFKDLRLEFTRNDSRSYSKMQNTSFGPTKVSFKEAGTYALDQIYSGRNLENKCKILGLPQEIEVKEYDGRCHAMQKEVYVRVDCR